jgi:hypothetical protein
MRLLGWRPAEGLLPRARGKADPEVATLVARGGAGPLPGGSRGGPGPRGLLERQAHRGLAPTRGGAGSPGGSGPVEAIPKYLALMGTRGHRTYVSSGGRSGDHVPSCQVRTAHPDSQRTRVRAWKTLCPPGWTVCQMTSWRAGPPERQISS